jgi:hypothetical protein
MLPQVPLVDMPGMGHDDADEEMARIAGPFGKKDRL